MEECRSEGPYDLNLPVACAPDSSLLQVVRRALSLGYRTIALNTEVHQSQFVTKKEKGRKEGANVLADFPAPPALALTPSDYPALHALSRAPTILTRLTITMTNNDFMIAYNKSAVAKTYDLLAINCSSSPALTALLKSSFRFDLLTFTPDQVVGGIRWTRKLYYECVERHVHFEINYAPMIRGSEDRRRVISQAHTFHDVGRSRAILLSSAARAPLELRAPTDVGNLGFLLGLKQAAGVAAVQAAGAKVERAAMGRKMGPFRVRLAVLGEENMHLAPAPAEEITHPEPAEEEEGEAVAV